MFIARSTLTRLPTLSSLAGHLSNLGALSKGGHLRVNLRVSFLEMMPEESVVELSWFNSPFGITFIDILENLRQVFRHVFFLLFV